MAQIEKKNEAAVHKTARPNIKLLSERETDEHKSAASDEIESIKL